jgi:hypothetical protein
MVTDRVDTFAGMATPDVDQLEGVTVVRDNATDNQSNRIELPESGMCSGRRQASFGGYEVPPRPAIVTRKPVDCRQDAIQVSGLV